MTTGEKLQSLRKQNNYTQEELAEIMNVSRQSISKWESDIAFPETEKLIALSKLYHCSIDYLLNPENEEVGNSVQSNSQAPTNKGYNKKRLPLIVTTMSTCVLSFFLFIPPWFYGTTYYHDFKVESTSNFYDLLKIKGDPFVNAQALCVLAYIVLFTTIALFVASFIYIFIDNKAFRISIRLSNILNLVFMTLLLILSVTADIEMGWTIVILFEYIFLAAQVLVQYAFKPIRLTR